MAYILASNITKPIKILGSPVTAPGPSTTTGLLWRCVAARPAGVMVAGVCR